MIRRIPLMLALAALLAAPAFGQGPSQDQLRANHAKLIAEDWFEDGGWTEDLEAAKERAREGDKLIVAYFTRSYAT